MVRYTFLGQVFFENAKYERKTFFSCPIRGKLKTAEMPKSNAKMLESLEKWPFDIQNGKIRCFF